MQFYPWFKIYFLWFLGLVMGNNGCETKEKKDKIKLQHNIRLPHFFTYKPSGMYFVQLLLGHGARVPYSLVTSGNPSFFQEATTEFRFGDGDQLMSGHCLWQ